MHQKVWCIFFIREVREIREFKEVKDFVGDITIP